MAQKMSLNLKQSQSLMMTPQLQQAIKLLTLTHMEMTSVIAKEMIENPMLEETGNESTAQEVEARSKETKEKKADDFSGPELIEKSNDNFDWDKYIENYNSNSSTPYTKEVRSKDDAPNYENMVSKGENLAEHLAWQLRMEHLTDEEWTFAKSVIHNINEDGYLDENLEELMAKSTLDNEDALELLKMIQHLDPVGCGARDLQECLLVQAQALELSVPLVEILIKDHLDDLIKRDFKKIEKAIGVDVDVIKDAECVLHSFNPKPGRLISPEDTQYVVPDIYIREVGGELQVHLNSEGVPSLKVSNLYKGLINKSKEKDETSDYVQDKLRSALWLIKSIENRQKTIEKVAHAIIRYQPEFFKKGTIALKPMILKDIANEIGVHESTVSRVTTNKFVHTPIGTYELKFFFNAGIGGKNGGIDIASESLKLKIKELIDHEDRKKPLSDQKIADILSKSDIKVARRTVAKYREGMRISPSSKRKNAS
ncbi:MAG: RNA polymerase factor sigma-54 [Halobacteriovoraceae bacterium]|jgi:RNA polymerase sigma-54 factor|nr:RNA polymerase factor sigma-54 [Halobacteriovoraceae bacterium]